MKQVFLIISFILCSTQINAQLKVNAGNDVMVCFPDKPLEARIQLGGIPAASGGIEPYTYTWSGKLPIYYDEDHIKWVKASEFLDDTTKSNPTFKSIDAPDDWVNFCLKVEDAVGNVQYDTVKIINAFIMSLNIYMPPVTIKRGDSIKFLGDRRFYENYKFIPFKLSFTPTYGLTDPTNLYTWAKPDTSTTYYLQAVNTVGCVAKVYYWRINVDPPTASTNEIENPSIQCYLIHSDLVVSLPSKYNSPYNLTITTASGVIIHEGQYVNRDLRLTGLNLKKNQLYLVTIIDGDEKQTFKLVEN